MPMMTSIHAFLIDDPRDHGDGEQHEGLAGVIIGGMALPLVCGGSNKLELLQTLAAELAKRDRIQVRHVVFQSPTLVEVFDPPPKEATP